MYFRYSISRYSFDKNWRPVSLPHFPLQWRHNDHDGVSNHQSHGCLLKRLFRRRSKKTSKLRVIGLCVGNSPGPVNSPHKRPVTRKMFPFDDVIMSLCISDLNHYLWIRYSNALLHFASHDSKVNTLNRAWKLPTFCKRLFHMHFNE